MGVDEWGAVWRLLAVCVGAGGSIVAVFWGLMLIFKPVAQNAAANATERLHDKLRQSDLHEVGQRFGRMEQRIDKRMDGFEERMDGLEERMDGLEERMGGLEERMDRLETLVVQLGKTVREDNATVLAAIERLSAAVTGGAAGHGTVGAVAQG